MEKKALMLSGASMTAQRGGACDTLQPQLNASSAPRDPRAADMQRMYVEAMLLGRPTVGCAGVTVSYD